MGTWPPGNKGKAESGFALAPILRVLPSDARSFTDKDLQCVLRMSKVSNFVDSVRISAFADPETQNLAKTIDQARHSDQTETLSYPDVQWARGELDNLKAGKPSALKDVVKAADVDKFEARFAKVEEAVATGHGLLGLIRRPPLKLGGVVYDNVFELPEQTQLDPLLELTRESGMDQLIVQDAEGKRYIALGKGGRLKRAQKNMEGLLAGDEYKSVRVVHVEDMMNSFFEGALLIPRRIGEMMDQTFRSTVDKTLEEGVRGGIAGGVDRINAPQVAATKKPSKLIAASAVSLGAVGMSTFIAVAPEIAAGVAGLAVVGSVYNAVRGALRGEDPYLILNVVGVHLANSKKVKLEDLA